MTILPDGGSGGNTGSKSVVVVVGAVPPDMVMMIVLVPTVMAPEMRGVIMVAAVVLAEEGVIIVVVILVVVMVMELGSVSTGSEGSNSSDERRCQFHCKFYLFACFPTTRYGLHRCMWCVIASTPLIATVTAH